MIILKCIEYVISKIKWFYIICKYKHLKRQIAYCGRHSIIFPPFDIGYRHNLSIGSYCCINPYSFINCSGGVEIGDGTIIGPHLTIYSIMHDYKNAECIPFSNTDIYSKVKIGRNCWIGTNVIILSGVLIGDGCIIGAGAVITKSYPKGSVIVGNPSCVVKTRDLKQYDEMVKKNVYLDYQKNLYT